MQHSNHWMLGGKINIKVATHNNRLVLNITNVFTSLKVSYV